jgi:hypothetical protein
MSNYYFKKTTVFTIYSFEYYSKSWTILSGIRKLPVDILGITFNQGVDILGKKCLN